MPLAAAALPLLTAHLLPGALLVRLLGLGRSSFERWTMAAVLGGPLAAAVYLLALVVGWPPLYWFLLLLLDLMAAYALLRRRPASRLTLDPAPPAKVLPFLFLLAGAVEAAYCITTGVFFRLDGEGNLVMDRALQRDTLFHLGLVRALESGYPPELLSVSGVRVDYHLGYHLQLAAWSRFFGLDPFDGIYRIGPVWSLGLLILSAFVLGLRFSRNPWVSLAATALLFGSGLGFLFPDAPGADWWSLLFMDLALVSLFLVNPLLPALPLLFIGFACLDDYLAHGRSGALAGSSLALASLFAVKTFLGAQVLGGVGLAALLARGPGASRLRRAALALTLASAPFLLQTVQAARRSNTSIGWRPFEIVRYSMEKLGWEESAHALAGLTEGRFDAAGLSVAAGATAFWLAGFLGLRLAGVKGLARDAVSRAGSLRHALALFVLLGFPPAILLRIAPAEATGLSRIEAQNDALWFAAQSGILMWIWAAEGLGNLCGRSRMRLALVAMAGSLLAFPATFQHFIHKASLPPDLISREAVVAALSCRGLSSPGEVFVVPPDRVRPSPIAYLAGRPVVFDAYVGYDYMFVSRRQIEFRRHAVAQFWQSSDPGYVAWFLDRFKVSWIYATPEGPLPEAAGRWAEMVLASEAVTLFRVSEKIPGDLSLQTPSVLPLGLQGARFFGEGWGSPEGSPRFRRLLPGGSSLYLPLDEGSELTVTLEVETPHAPGEISLGRLSSGGVTHFLDGGEGAANLKLPPGLAAKGLNHLQLLWQGSEPLKVRKITLTVSRPSA